MGVRRLALSSTDLWKHELEYVGADPVTWDRLSMKASVLVFSVDPMPCVAANILKQCMLSGGADAIVSRHSISCRDSETRALVVGTPKQIMAGCRSLSGQPFRLSELAGELQQALSSPPVLTSRINAGKMQLDFTMGPLIMGILNVTPDSFSDGGKYLDHSDAVEHAISMSRQGAHIIDIGAESTRPGSLPVDPKEQIGRLVPLIDEISSQLEAVISVDTASAEVARAAIQAGASMVNDVTALSDPEMGGIVADAGVPLVLMHMQGKPETMQDKPEYRNVVEEVYRFLESRIEEAESCGISRGMIVVDPGIGFGKRLQDNIQLISRISEFRWLGCRVLLGHSRKSFLGELTGIREPWQREAGTHAVTALSSCSADIFRVHDVEGTRQVLQVTGVMERGQC